MNVPLGKQLCVQVIVATRHLAELSHGHRVRTQFLRNRPWKIHDVLRCAIGAGTTIDRNVNLVTKFREGLDLCPTLGALGRINNDERHVFSLQRVFQ